MASFRFIGDPKAEGHGPKEQELFGIVFTRDEWSEVPDALIERCDRHTHLERRKGGRPPKVRDDADDAGDA